MHRKEKAGIIQPESLKLSPDTLIRCTIGATLPNNTYPGKCYLTALFGKVWRKDVNISKYFRTGKRGNENK